MPKNIFLPAPPLHGIHSAVYRTAAILRENKATPDSALKILYRWRTKHTFRRPVPDSEILDAWHAVYAEPIVTKGVGQQRRTRVGTKTRSTTSWPSADPTLRSSLIDNGFGLYDLWEESPFKPATSGAHAQYLLERLFPGDPLLCLGWDAMRFDTRPLSEWTSPETMQFLTPSPMIARMGRRKSDNGLSSHTLDNTGPRRFTVVDFDDHAGLDMHAAASWYLAKRLPLVLALHSGGKSLHAWFYTAGLSESALLPEFQLACKLGGDKALWTRSQFARIPDGTRANGEVQRAYYFNPEVLK
jgi:hypothetical protein